MPASKRPESDDLGDYEVLDGSDTLDGDPGDDPLDRGLATPDHWSSAQRPDAGAESLDELVAEEEPDISAEPGDDTWDENATDQDVARYERDDDADPRAGRLVPEDEDVYEGDDVRLSTEDEFTARDTGIDGGGASAEEAAEHVIDDAE
jgi:hypothetical protein